MVHGGIAPNVIADKAYFYWDLRTIPMDDVQEIMAEFESYCQQREQELRKVFPEFAIKTIENHPPVPHLDTKADDDVVELIRCISGKSKLNTVAYASEVGQFANEGFQSAICGPGDIAQAHRPNEFIEIEQLHLGVEMLKKLIDELSLSENYYE